MWVGFLAARLVVGAPDGGPSASVWLVPLLSTALGAAGFLDDLIKLRRHRNLGLSKTAELLGQLLTAVTFAVLGLTYVIIGYGQFRHLCAPLGPEPGCFAVRDPLDVALAGIFYSDWLAAVSTS